MKKLHEKSLYCVSSCQQKTVKAKRAKKRVQE